MRGDDRPRFDVDAVERWRSQSGPILVGHLTSGAIEVGDRLTSVTDETVSVRVVAIELHVPLADPDRRTVAVNPDLGDRLRAGVSFWVASRDIEAL
jgi:hypothetical protein